MKPILLSILALLPSCATQVVTSKDGTRLVQIEAFGKASLKRNADGSVEMTSDHEKAVEPAAKALRVAGYMSMGKFALDKAPSIATAVKP